MTTCIIIFFQYSASGAKVSTQIMGAFAPTQTLIARVNEKKKSKMRIDALSQQLVVRTTEMSPVFTGGDFGNS